MTGYRDYKTELRHAKNDLDDKIRAADDAADDAARLICGRLRSVDACALKKMKKELTQFNAHTGEWKS